MVGLLVLATALAIPGCRAQPDAWSVVLITLDTTRADHLGAYGYPHVDTPTLDRLAAGGVRYERCYSPAPLTLPSHASLMTGLYPLRHGLHHNGTDRLAEGAVTLAERLEASGYATGAVIGAFVLDHEFGLAQGFDHYDDDLSQGSDPGRFSYARRDAEAVTDSALGWLERHQRRNHFLWVHYFDAHAPYQAPGTSEQRLNSARSPYDAEIGYVDAQLGRLVGFLDQSGAANHTLLVITADHGEALWEHGELTHGLFAYDATLHVPLIVRFPDGRHAGASVAEAVSLVDLMPSILAWLGQASPPGLDGRELPLPGADAVGGERPLAFENLGPAHLFGWSPLRGIVVGDHKWIQAPRPELYDLAADPHETRDLYRSGTGDSNAWQARFDGAMQELEAQPRLVARATGLDPASQDKLRALGYVTGPPAGSDTETAAIDPKDMVQVYQQVEVAMSLIEQGRAPDGVDQLASVVSSSDPSNRRALTILAELAREEPTLRARAIEGLRAASQSASGDDELDLFVRARLGLALVLDERDEEAIEAYRRALEIDPARPGVHYRLGLAYQRTGAPLRALSALRRALELAPADAPPWHSDAKSRIAALEIESGEPP